MSLEDPLSPLPPTNWTRDAFDDIGPQFWHNLQFQTMADRPAAEAASEPTPTPSPAPQVAVNLEMNKVKERAETQLHCTLTMSPLDANVKHLRMPRDTLVRAKQCAADPSSYGPFVSMQTMLVCEAAMQTDEDWERALRRARGEEPIPRRPKDVALKDLDEDDPALPQNGGEIIICDQCRSRECTRYSRRKTEMSSEEAEFWPKARERVIVINENEFMAWNDADADPQSPSGKKTVDFVLRITCYCRHQRVKTPGYRIVFTFRDSDGKLIAQRVSHGISVNDNHKDKKSKEKLPTSIPPTPVVPPATIQQLPQLDFTFNQSVSNAFYNTTYQIGSTAYSQPVTPVDQVFQQTMSPTQTWPNDMAAQGMFLPHSTESSDLLLPTTINTADLYMPTSPEALQFTMTPVSLPRHHSFDSLQNYSWADYGCNYNAPITDFASAPPSSVTTPINLSRSTSPTWEQGPRKKARRSLNADWTGDDMRRGW